MLIMRPAYLRLQFLMFGLIAVGFGLLLSGSLPVSAGVEHPSIAVDTPRSDTPIVLDGTVYSSIQLHDRVIVGGEFTRVQTVRNGPIVDRINIFAYDINTGEIIDDFAPALTGRVRVMHTDPDTDSFYVGGTFTQVDGVWQQRIAKIGYDGTLDTAFKAKASAEVHTIELHNGVVYLGGSFAFVNNETHTRIAAVDATTGASIDGFDLAVDGDLGKADSGSVRHLEVHPDGRRMLVVSNSQQIIDANGAHDRFGVGFIDLNTYTVTPWRTQWFELAYQRCSQQSMQVRDASFSPDGSQFDTSAIGAPLPNKSSCSECAPNWYRNASVATCVPCPATSSTSFPGGKIAPLLTKFARLTSSLSSRKKDPCKSSCSRSTPESRTATTTGCAASKI